MSKKAAKGKVEKTMKEFKQGTLHAGSKQGPKVKNRSQAIAIALAEKKRKGGIVSKVGKALG